METAILLVSAAIVTTVYAAMVVRRCLVAAKHTTNLKDFFEWRG